MTILRALSNGGKLATAAALSFERMSAEYGRPIPTSSTTRTFAEQSALYRGWIYRLPGYNYALPPGTSVHERGYAIDVAAAARLWMGIHAAEHGWYRTNPAEWWHYEYAAARDTRALDRPAPLTPITPPPVPKDDAMLPFIAALYRAYLDREGSPFELLDWTRTAAKRGLDTTATEVAFRQSKPEDGTVRAAYRRYLGREPLPGDVTAWTAYPSIDAVFAGVSASVEARSR